MRTLFLENFRAFKDSLEIKLEDHERNILLYGENGAGKSSLFDAFELFYFYNTLESKALIGSIDETQETQLRNDWLRSYLCKMASSPNFTLKIDGNNYNDHIDRSSFEVFMISNRNIPSVNKISVKDLLSNIRFTGLDVDIFLGNRDNREFIKSYVNDALETDFFESVKISFDQNEEFCLEIKDIRRGNLQAINNIHQYFNEAKVKLISLLVLFTVAEMLMDLNDSLKQKILVLDDIINSFDASNRIMLMRYIFKTFNKENLQIINMTHNVSYYNLWYYFIKEQKQNHLWKNINIYVSNENHKIINYKEDQIESIKNDYRLNPSDMSIGNRLRQHFERLLYELAKIMQVGPFIESDKLINDIVNRKHIYLNISTNGDASNGYIMMEEIRKKYKYWKTCTWKPELKKILDKYNSTNDFDYLKKIIDEVVIYQKVALHQSSHGHSGIHTIGDKEIKAAIYLLEKMENAINGQKDRNVYTV